jgi:hypothetical protein
LAAASADPSGWIVASPTEPVFAAWPVPSVPDVASLVWAEPWSEAEPPTDRTEPPPDFGPFCTLTLPADDDNQNRLLPEETSCGPFAPVEMPS